MSNFVSVNGDDKCPKVNTDLLVSVEETIINNETKYKHCFLGGLVMILDEDLTESNE